MAQVKATHKGRTVQPTSPTKVDKRHRVSSAEDWSKSGKWVRVKSSNVAAIAYDNHRRIMMVEFKGGAVYHYFHMGPTVARQFFNASSMGKFVWRIRRADYEYKRVR